MASEISRGVSYITGNSNFGDMANQGILTSMYHLTGGKGFGTDYSTLNWNAIDTGVDSFGSMLGSRLNSYMEKEKETNDPLDTGKPVQPAQGSDPLGFVDDMLGAAYYGSQKVKEYLNEIQAGVSGGLKGIVGEGIAGTISSGLGYVQGIGGNIDSTFGNIGMVAATGVMTAGTAAWEGAVNAVTSVKSWLEDYAGSNETVIEGSVSQLSDSPESDAEEMARDIKYKSHIYKSTNPETYVKRLVEEYRKRGEDVTEDDIKNAFAEANNCSWDEVREMFLQGGQRIYELDGMGWNKTVQDKYTAEEAEKIIREINEGVKLIAESMERLLEQPDTNTVVRNAGTEKGILDEFASDLHSWAAEVRKGPNEFGEYIGNNRGAGLAACIVGSILGPAVSLGFGEALAAAPVWAPIIFGGSKAEIAINTTIAGINTAAYVATDDNPTVGGAVLNFSESYGLSRIGSEIAALKELPLFGKSILTTSIGGGIDFSIQTVQIQTGYRDRYDYWQIGGNAFVTGLSVLPGQSFRMTGEIGTDIWTHAFPKINTALSSTMFFSSMSWYENQRKKNNGRGR